MRYEIREFGVGQILDQAVLITKHRFGLLLAIMAVLQIPIGLVAQFIPLHQLPPQPLNLATPEGSAFLQAMVKMFLMAAPVWLLLLVVVNPITTAALTHALCSIYLGQPVTFGQAMKRGFAKWGPMLWTMFLYNLVVTVGLFMCLIPGVVLALWCGLGTLVVMQEGTWGIAALLRSRELMRGNMANMFILLLLLGVMAYLVGGSSQLIPQQHLQVTLFVVLQAALTIFQMASFVVLYYSCRCHHEHFDLLLLAREVATDTPAAPAPVQA